MHRAGSGRGRGGRRGSPCYYRGTVAGPLKNPTPSNRTERARTRKQVCAPLLAGDGDGDGTGGRWPPKMPGGPSSGARGRRNHLPLEIGGGKLPSYCLSILSCSRGVPRLLRFLPHPSIPCAIPGPQRSPFCPFHFPAAWSSSPPPPPHTHILLNHRRRRRQDWPAYQRVPRAWRDGF